MHAKALRWFQVCTEHGNNKWCTWRNYQNLTNSKVENKCIIEKISKPIRYMTLNYCSLQLNLNS